MATVNRLGRLVRSTDISLGPYSAAGYVWLTGVHKVSLTTSQKYNFTLQNPNGSGKTLTILQIILFASNSLFFEMHLDPTTDLPTTALGIRNAIFDGRSYSGATLVKADVLANELSGGTAYPIGLGVGAGSTTVINTSFILPPNHMIGLHTLAAANMDFSLTFAFVEQ